MTRISQFSLVLLAFLLVGMAAVSPVHAQDYWWVTFTDKPQQQALSVADWDPKALARRQKMGIAFPTWEDLPVNEEYVKAVAGEVDSLRYALRWLNAVTVRATPEQIARLRQLPFVLSVEPFTEVEMLPLGLVPEDSTPAPKGELETLLAHQRRLLGLDALSQHGLTGKGVRIAVLDAGFKDMDEHEAFKHLFTGGKIILSKDFYGNKADAYYHCYHGTSVVSAIAGKWKGQDMGAAPDAEFLLARTEHLFSEKIIEEDHWFAAMEWADQRGADLISSSLGYGWKRYEWPEVDGLGTKVTQAARIAVRKGIFVCNSIGNDGGGKHPWLSAPADADSVCAVGGSYPMMRYAIPFTSLGPNGRGILKPDVAAPAYVLTARKTGEYISNAGTSFATPLVSGMVACMMQLHPGKSNMELLQMLRGIGHFYPYYDYRLGNGVPDARLLFSERQAMAPTFETAWIGDTLLLSFPPALVDSLDEAKENGKPLFLHVAAENGRLISNYQFRIQKGDYTAKFPMRQESGTTLRVWWEGYLWERRR